MTTQALTLSNTDTQDTRLMRLMTRLSPPMLILMGIMLLAAFLNFVNIAALGDGNTYYTAAVEAMLQSPSNFFFIAAEPGGSVTIDKPPLGLWLQAISAFFLGVNGFAVVLPQILAGIFSVPLVYALVKRYAGTGAGLIAALVMAVMPVSVAVQRNNTMDATLIFALLLATWAFIQATESGKLKWLIAGGVLIGLGFNIKMLQAFLPVPAFYALYFLGARVGWRTKIVHLSVATAVMLVVAFSWVIVVDLTSEDQRPYVGSSETNSALELAIGYNGLQRLLGNDGGGARTDDGAVASSTDGQMSPPTGFAPSTNTDGQFTPPSPPNGMTPPDGTGVQGGGMFGDEIGTAGVLRLFTQPLDNEIGWLLPFSLFGLGLVVIANRPRLPLTDAHKAAILWGGWLLTMVVFFSMASFFHAYYLAMLTPAAAALVGIGVMRLWQIHTQRKLLAIGLIVAAAAGTLVYQAAIASGYTDSWIWLAIPAAVLVIGTGVLMAARFVPRYARFAPVGFAAVAVAMIIVPAVWAGAGTLDSSTGNTPLPAAYAGDSADARGQGPTRSDGIDGANAAAHPDDGGFAPGDGTVDDELIAYLQENTEGMRWMLAVSSSHEGADLVLETGRGVMYMGGFSGTDPAVDVDDLQAYVEAGELRYVMSSGSSGRRGPGMGSNTAINDWLTTSCTVVTDVTTSGTLYDCAG